MMEFKSLEELKGMFEWQDFENDIQLHDLEVGEGDEVLKGDNITAHYTLWDDDGEMLQSSLESGQPFSSGIGVGRLIKGWDVAVPGMKAGGKRLLIIPGDMAYGSSPRPGSGIKPNATLVFELQILETER
jgi:FKBP-type peptidyl-prolyl cis-trans isomerase